MNYEHKDYSGLLSELNSTSASVVEDKNISDSQQDREVKAFGRKLTRVQFLVNGGYDEKTDYLQLLSDILDVLQMVLSGKYRFNPVVKRFRNVDRKDLARIQSFITELGYAIDEKDEKNKEFYRSRLHTDGLYIKMVDAYLHFDDGNAGGERVRRIKHDQLQQIRSDVNVRYFYDDEKHIIHDKTCVKVAELIEGKYTYGDKYNIAYNRCDKCELKSYIRYGATDIKQYEQYERIFDELEVDIEDVRKMYLLYDFKTTIDHIAVTGNPTKLGVNNAIEVKCKEDSWKIGCIGDKRVRLEHNNYKRHRDGSRTFAPTYHVQIEDTDFKFAISSIQSYEYKYHVKANEEPAVEEVVAEATVEEVKKEKVSIIRRFINWLKRNKTTEVVAVDNPKMEFRTEERPSHRQICMYQWTEYNGNVRWDTGIYIAKDDTFKVEYYGYKRVVSFDRVIKWLPLDDVQLG